MRVDLVDNGGLDGHFHLHPRNGYARGPGPIFSGQVNAGRAEATANIQKIRIRLHARQLSQMINQLNLGLFLGFVATHPIAVMQVLSPERAIVGAEDVVVLNDPKLVIRTRHCHSRNRSNQAN